MSIGDIYREQMDMQTFWNSRASLGTYAGTRDRIVKELEMRAIARELRGYKVLDMGCGDGETANYLAERFGVSIDAVDFSPEMLANARSLVHNSPGTIRYSQRSLFSWTEGGYDTIYTERCIINLPDWPTQLMAIQHLISLLRLGGRYVMVECSMSGLANVNRMRDEVGLPAIIPPEHTRYLREQELHLAVTEGKLDGFLVKDFTLPYYFLSRVVNAKLAQQEGQEPDYEADVNKLALEMPPDAFPGMGQVRLWLFQHG
jgi:ubiquinone/menaquinone biosynthesis C-methylase UbiE